MNRKIGIIAIVGSIAYQNPFVNHLIDTMI